MSDQPTLFDSRIAEWLEDGPDTAPSIVLDSLAAALPSIPQRHSWRQFRRYSQMSRFAVAASATVVVLAVAAALFMSRLIEPGPASSPTPTPSLEATNRSSPRPSVTDNATSSPSDTPGVPTLSPADVGRVLSAGTYRVDGFAVPFSVTLPDRWRPEEFTANSIRIANTADDGLVNISLLVVDKVYPDPCSAEGGPQPVESGVEDLVAALSTMAGFEVDGLRDASVGGAAGKAFTLTNAVDTETENCVGGSPWLWIGTYDKDGSDELVRTIGGSLDPMWVVDVAGTTVLIAPGIRDGSSSSLAAAESIVDAISWADVAGAPSVTSSGRPALTETFTSDIHGASISYPAGWTVLPATLPWDGLNVPSMGSGTADIIYEREDESPFIALASVPTYGNEGTWVDEFAESFTSKCPASTEPVTIDVRGGVIVDVCAADPGRPLLALVSVPLALRADRGYLIYVHRVDDVEWFKEILSTVRLEPVNAVDPVDGSFPPPVQLP